MRSHSFSSLQTLLRPTLLLVTLLSQQASAPAVHVLRARGSGLVEQLQQDLLDSGYDEASRSEVSYAQCALLDDAVRRHLPAAQRAEWDREWLQARFFGARDAQDVVLARIEETARGMSSSSELATLYRTMLGLDFAKGTIDATYRQELMTALGRFEAPAHRAPTSTLLPPAFAVQAGAPTAPARRNGWARAAIVVACLVALWAGASLHISRLLHQMPQPAATPHHDIPPSSP